MDNTILKGVFDNWNYGDICAEWRDARPKTCGMANPCPACGNEGEEDCPIASSLTTGVLCAIANLKKPEDGWPDDAIDDIVEAAHFVANY